MKARIETITLKSPLPKQLRDFYANVFHLRELEHLSSPPNYYILDGRGCKLCFRKEERAPSKKRERVELSFEVEDLVRMVKSIKMNGGIILPEVPVDAFSPAFYANDPDGNLLLVHYCFVNQPNYYY